jgi:hypothetical protein
MLAHFFLILLFSFEKFSCWQCGLFVPPSSSPVAAAKPPPPPPNRLLPTFEKLWLTGPCNFPADAEGRERKMHKSESKRCRRGREMHGERERERERKVVIYISERRNRRRKKASKCRVAAPTAPAAPAVSASQNQMFGNERSVGRNCSIYIHIKKRRGKRKKQI